MCSHGGDFIMIRKFSVENFKGFKEKITLDLSRTRDYSFNSNLIKNQRTGEHDSSGSRSRS